MNEENKKVDVTEENEKNYIGKAKGIYAAIQEHLTPEYRKQYKVRKFFSCLLLFLVINSILPVTSVNGFISMNSVVPLIWTIIAWLFWHYSFWSYQGGIIDKFSRNIIYFGSIWSLIWKIFVQNIVILIWIAFIAPFSGIKTWRKAVKNNKTLFVDNDQDDPWK
ncbi:hypothetical protein [Liquorilactobacillus mali]|uniref:hypothetical protein n=1 Tax=Liquorilactobacillus mali TaxID=1618 RepID=UPI0029544750|nr:hypothetical protein [Liquorilactobacillus mali]MDV7757856.1 hypothetical protein [Liquorilactobacillus mali]